MYKSIGQNIRSYMTLGGMNIGRLARLTDTTPAYIRSIVYWDMRTKITLDLLLRISHALNVPLSKLVEERS